MTIHALLIDDDPDTRGLVTLALDLDPRFTVTAMSRFEAASLLRRGTARIDVILLNTRLTDMRAGALVAMVRQWSREPVPIVLVSGNADDIDHAACRMAGAQGLIAKPFDPVALPDRVAEMIAPDPVAHGLAASAR